MTIGSCRAYFLTYFDMGDVNGDGKINISDVTVLIGLVLSNNYVINNLNVVVNGAEGLTFGGTGAGPAR